MSFIPESLSTKQKALAGVAVAALLAGGFLVYRAVFAPSGLPPVSASEVGDAGTFETTSNAPTTPAAKGATQPQPQQDKLPDDLRGGQRTAPR